MNILVPIGGLAGIVLLAVTWRVAYQAGFSEGRLSVPLRFIRALGEHRVRCEGEDVATVVLEIGRELHLPREETQRLLETLPTESRSVPKRASLRPAS
jgi:hypothetical protein